jgi:glycosyltransferase involved in cell wall biosynthesis
VSTVHVIVPDGIDDPTRPSGGNAYDRRICQGLAKSGWRVRERVVPGEWPCPDAAARAALTEAMGAVPDGSPVLLDGLIASTVPDVLVPEAGRVRLVVLVHAPMGAEGAEAAGDRARTALERERAVLSAAEAVLTTSAWTRRWLLDRYALHPERVHVARPGVDAGDLASGTPGGRELLCVAAVTPVKGHDVLLGALTRVADASWRCICVGSLTRDARFVERLRRQARADGTEDRVHFAGPLSGADLAAAYARADLLVLASQAETYGMVVTEALARGLPVVATGVGGVPEALGRTADGSRPGVLVPVGDPAALAFALRGWLGDRTLRERLRAAARERRLTLTGWSDTSARVARVLNAVAA